MERWAGQVYGSDNKSPSGVKPVSKNALVHATGVHTATTQAVHGH